ncbi:hypothetical protein BH11PSE14_BH11PSE14_21900 [soil metagenome]
MASPTTPFLVATGTLMLAWLLLGTMLVIARMRQRGQRGDGQRRDLRSWMGLGLQGVGFAIAWGVHRPTGASLLPGMGPTSDWMLALATAALAMASSLFACSAIRTLGKQWSLTARVLDSHQLVTDGAFALVRNPIYTGLLGLLIATGFVFATWQAIPVAVLVYVLGTLSRVQREEILLRDMFGAAFDDYAARVPRLLPRLVPGLNRRA